MGLGLDRRLRHDLSSSDFEVIEELTKGTQPILPMV